MRLSPDIRGTFSRLVKKGLEVSRIAELFDTSRQTVYRWINRARDLVEALLLARKIESLQHHISSQVKMLKP